MNAKNFSSTARFSKVPRTLAEICNRFSDFRMAGQGLCAPEAQNGNRRYNCSQPRMTAPRGLTVLLLAVLFASASAAHAATNDPTIVLQKGLFEEEANHNLEAAIQAYQSVVSQFDRDRKLAATAIFRLGECYRKQGNTNQASSQYERVLREFADQPQLATISRQNLAALGVAPSAASALSGAQTSTTSTEAVTAGAEAAALKAQLDFLSQLTPEQKRVAVQQDFPNPVLTSLMEQLGLAEQKLVAFRKEYGPENNDVKKAEALVQTTEKQVDAQVSGVLTGLQARLGATMARAAALAQADHKQPPTETSSNGATVPATATEAEEVKRIQGMIKDSPDLINARMSEGEGYTGWTPLQKAAYLGQMVVARFLLDNGADVTATTLPQNGGQTPLHLAAQKGHAAMAGLLLSRKADVNAANDQGETPLHLAAENGFRTVVEVLLDRGADVNARTRSDATPLHLAVYNGFKSVAELLLTRGADVNAQGATGNDPGRQRWTALHLAAKRGDQPLTELLLANKAELKAADREGSTPLHIAAEWGQIGIVTLFLSQRADINSKGGSGTREGWTPLYCAVNSGRKEMVAFLLKNKADPNVQIESGSAASQPVEFTPLLLASAKTLPEIVESLLDYKADPNVPNPRGFAPIFHALTFNSSNMAERNRILTALLEHGADPNAKDPANGQTPLLRAVAGANKEAVALLIAHKGDVNAKDNEGRTALIYAAQSNGSKNMLPIAELLLAAGADANARSNNGSTALGYTGGPHQGVMADLLGKHGAIEDLPLLDRIEVRRPSTGYRATVLLKGTNDYNRFTLFELLAAHYGFVSTATGTENVAEKFDYQSFTRQTSLAFPDLTHVVIRRPTAGGTDRIAIDVNLDAVFKSGVCSGDVPLRWGDVVELPEADHPISATWQGLPTEDLGLLQQCLQRGVQLTVKGQTTNLVLSPKFLTSKDYMNYMNNVGIVKQVEAFVPQFSLLPALVSSGMLRASSDLSRVRVHRRDAQSGQIYELVFDCSNPRSPPNFWLRNGDEVDVPEKL